MSDINGLIIFQIHYRSRKSTGFIGIIAPYWFDSPGFASVAHHILQKLTHHGVPRHVENLDVNY